MCKNFNFWFHREDSLVLDQSRQLCAIEHFLQQTNIDWASETLASFAADCGGGGLNVNPWEFPRWFAATQEWWRFKSVVDRYQNSRYARKFARDEGQILVLIPREYMRGGSVSVRDCAHYERILRSWIREEEREFIGLECLTQALREVGVGIVLNPPLEVAPYGLTVREKVTIIGRLLVERDRELGKYYAVRGADYMNVWSHSLDELLNACRTLQCSTSVSELIKENYPSHARIQANATLAEGDTALARAAAQKYYEELGRLPEDWDDGALKIVSIEGRRFLVGVLEYGWKNHSHRVRKWQPADVDAKVSISGVRYTFTLGVKVL